MSDSQWPAHSTMWRWEQNNNEMIAQQKKSLKDSNATIARIKAEQKVQNAQPLTIGAITFGPSATANKLCYFGAFGSCLRQGEWVSEAELQQRREFHSDFVLPHSTSKSDRVRTGLQKDGSVSILTSEIHTIKYFVRYRKWRKHCALSHPVALADLPHIEKVTGWKAGCDHWLMRLLGFGPGPRWTWR